MLPVSAALLPAAASGIALFVAADLMERLFLPADADVGGQALECLSHI